MAFTHRGRFSQNARETDEAPIQFRSDHPRGPWTVARVKEWLCLLLRFPKHIISTSKVVQAVTMSLRVRSTEYGVASSLQNLILLVDACVCT